MCVFSRPTFPIRQDCLEICTCFYLCGGNENNDVDFRCCEQTNNDSSESKFFLSPALHKYVLLGVIGVRYPSLSCTLDDLMNAFFMQDPRR